MVEVIRELHVERLIGQRAYDVNGQPVGRVHELCVENIDGETVVTELRFGPGAVLERIAGFVFELPFFSLVPHSKKLRCARWEDVDLSDVHRPTLRIPRESLKHVEPVARAGRQR